MSVVALREELRSPVVVLNQALAKVARIKAVCLVIQWDDETFEVDFSPQKVSEMCMAAMMLDEEARLQAKGDED